MDNIFLIGFMGCGKSTVAACLQEQYEMQVIEMDQVIAESQEMSIPDIFEKRGEAYFRDLETALLNEMKTRGGQVVSCGGGVVLREENVDIMKESGTVVLLTAKPETILKRVMEDDGRPILKGKKTVEEIEKLMEVRREKYEKAADFIVSTDNKKIRKIAEEIMNQLKGESVC